MRILSLGLVAVLIAACSGAPSVVSEAEQVCKARGHSAGSAVYDKCVFDVSESIYDRWGRKHISRGD